MAGAASPGARHFHRIVRGLALVCAVATGIGAASSFGVYLHKLGEVASGRDIYAGVQQFASLTYYSIWFMVSLLAVAATFQKRYPMLALYPLLAVLIEGLTWVHFVATRRHMFVAQAPVLLARFDPHPYLQITGHPGDLGMGVSHDGEGRRTTVNEGKAADPRYVYVFGGSTAYDIGVADSATWPSQLSRDLGPDFAVENYGLPMFSSLESLLQSLFVFRDRRPACAIYYLGAGDVRNTHVRNLRVDYSDFHSPIVLNNLQPGGRNPLVTYSVFLAALDTVINPPRPRPFVTGKTSSDPDPRLLKIYRDNIELIARIDRSFAVTPIFVPEVPDYERLGREGSIPLPFVRDEDNPAFIRMMDETMQQAAEEAGGVFLGKNRELDWGNADFLDAAHFSAAGSKKLADALADDVRRLCGGP